MVKCEYCGKEVVLPFRCPYCKKYFCYEHRLPENHGCKELRSRFYVPRLTPRAPTRTLTQASMAKPKFSDVFKMTSPTEIKHLAVGLAVFALIGFSMLVESIPIFLLKPDILFLTLTGMLASFLIHELAHKLAAQRMGYWAEFRLSISGLFMTLLSIILPIKIVAPGAVKVIGLRFSKEDVGKVALMGPLTNVVQAVIYIALRRFVAFGSLMYEAMLVLAILNLSLALFNLIPFGPLDGAKVFRWSRSVWFSVLVSVLAVWLSLSTPF